MKLQLSETEHAEVRLLAEQVDDALHYEMDSADATARAVRYLLALLGNFCEQCSGRGTHQLGPCVDCGGTGKRP
jgi:hypothetical protein